MTNSTPNTTQAQLKSFKEAGGEETLRFEASLYLDGEKAAVVANGGTGGAHIYHFTSKSLRDKFDQMVTDIQTTELRKDDWLHRHVAGWLAMMQSSIPDYAQDNVDRDVVIHCLIADLEEQKLFKRWCKKDTRTVYRLPSDPEGEYRTVSHLYTEAAKAHLIETHGSNIEIVNELIRA